MANDDIYPVESDRRRFVKGVVGSAAIAGLGASTVAAVNTATAPTGGGGGIRQFYGIERTAGPAPRGMPQIPLEIDDEGYLRGIWPEPEQREVEGTTFLVAEQEIADINYTTEWYQYCGVQNFPGFQPDADQNDHLLYDQGGRYEWQTEVEPETEMHVDDFDDYEEWGNEIGQDGIGKPATGTWRSEGAGAAETLPILVIRSTLIEDAAEESEWLAETAPEGFIAIANKCTHFCCVPTYKATQESERFNAGDGIYCQCHQSVYDPFSIQRQQFVALPRPDN